MTARDQSFRLQALREDYATMQQMFFGGAPRFDDILALLRQCESQFNQR